MEAVPMVKVFVAHHVADYDKWYPLFIEHGDVRRKYGATGHSINRDADDPNMLIVQNDFATMEGAHAFGQDPSLPEAMQRGGVDSTPTVWFTNEAESVRY
jgi:hypothetical protein